MQIQVAKTVFETVTIKPGYYQHNLCSKMFFQVFESGEIVAITTKFMAVYFTDEQYYPSKIQEIIECYTPCDQETFESAKDGTLSLFAGFIKFPAMATNVNPAVKDSVTNTMNIDPNAPQVNQEKATEQQNALESASQDQAMEVQDSEEGTTEG